MQDHTKPLSTLAQHRHLSCSIAVNSGMLRMAAGLPGFELSTWIAFMRRYLRCGHQQASSTGQQRTCRLTVLVLPTSRPSNAAPSAAESKSNAAAVAVNVVAKIALIMVAKQDPANPILPIGWLVVGLLRCNKH
jgi:hypothetical protein